MKRIRYTTAFLCLATAAVHAQQDGVLKPPAAPAQETSKEEIFTSVEQMPEFPGGGEGLRIYLANNVRYPNAAKEHSVQGRVVIQFIVDKTGEVTNAKIIRDIGGGCGEEARRVVMAMPKWKPGRHNGQPIRVYYTLPIKFTVQDTSPKRDTSVGGR